MTGDHPTDWAHRYVKAKALREAAADLRATTGKTWLDDRAATWLEDRADGLEQR